MTKRTFIQSFMHRKMRHHAPSHTIEHYLLMDNMEKLAVKKYGQSIKKSLSLKP